jgi:hypothetical protein
MRILLLLVLTLPLAGCFSVVAPKTVPEWAMDPQPAPGDAPPQRSAAVRHRVRPAASEQAQSAPPDGLAAVSSGTQLSDAAPSGAQPTRTQAAGLGKAVVQRKPTALPSQAAAASSKVAEPDWHAYDAEVARTINSICRGC